MILDPLRRLRQSNTLQEIFRTGRFRLERRGKVDSLSARLRWFPGRRWVFRLL